MNRSLYRVRRLFTIEHAQGCGICGIPNTARISAILRDEAVSPSLIVAELGDLSLENKTLTSFDHRS